MDKKSHNFSPSASSFTARFSDNYVYSVGIVAVLAIGICLFFCVQQKIKQETSQRRTTAVC